MTARPPRRTHQELHRAQGRHGQPHDGPALAARAVSEDPQNDPDARPAAEAEELCGTPATWAPPRPAAEHPGRGHARGQGRHRIPPAPPARTEAAPTGAVRSTERAPRACRNAGRGAGRERGLDLGGRHPGALGTFTRVHSFCPTGGGTW